jgi:tRNA U34 5-methylaminomethyl-2-thiouridine-forming methyltransferase MnmC
MDKPFPFKLIETEDGSHTLKLDGLNEQYHSSKGALQESQHIFIQTGLYSTQLANEPLFVLEVGMGTGLNALLTGREALMGKKRILYDACEAFPLENQIIEKLNYPSLFQEPWTGDLFDRIHKAGSVKYENIDDWFFIRCFHQKIQDMELSPGKYNLVYFDAFGPDTQPELWSETIFQKISHSMKPGGVLVTYSVKGTVRRAMESAGLKAEKLPGPPGKREITRAIKLTF